jgi:hypothetical protein
MSLSAIARGLNEEGVPTMPRFRQLPVANAAASLVVISLGGAASAFNNDHGESYAALSGRGTATS